MTTENLHLYETVDEVTYEIMQEKNNEMAAFEKHLQCGICVRTFDNPKDLMCRHSFCKLCIDKLLSFKNDGSAVITCPNKCKETTVLSTVQTTEDLDTSFHLKAMADQFNNKRIDRFSKELECSGEERCVKDLTVYCSTCTIFLCDSCYDNHTNNHEGHSYASIKFDNRDKIVRGWCKEHAAYAESVCYEEDCHRKLICMYCCYRRHKGHNSRNIQSLSNDIKTKFKNLQGEDKEIMNIRNQLIDNLKSRKTKCLEMYFSSVCIDEERILAEFENAVKRKDTVHDLNYLCTMLDKKSNIQIVLDDGEGNDGVTNERRYPVHVSLTDLQYKDACHLGHLHIGNGKSSTSTFSASTPKTAGFGEIINQMCVKGNYSNLQNPVGNGSPKPVPRPPTLSDVFSPYGNGGQVNDVNTFHPIPRPSKDIDGEVCRRSLRKVSNSSSEYQCLHISSTLPSSGSNASIEGEVSPDEISQAITKLQHKKFPYLSSLIGNNKVNLIKSIIPQYPDILHMRDSRTNETALHAAAETDCVEIIEVLRNKGAEMGTVDKFGNNILHAASYNNSSKVLSWQLNMDKSFLNARNASGETPLYAAARGGSETCVQILLQHGCDCEIKDSHGVTPLEAAKLKSEKCIFDSGKRKRYMRICEELRAFSRENVNQKKKSII